MADYARHAVWPKTLHSETGALLRFLSSLLVLSSLAASYSNSDYPVQFVEVTQDAGIHWIHENGATPEKFLIETMGGGGAFLDFDNDGWMDIYLVNSGSHLRSSRKSAARNALYRNNGDGTFADVTQRAGVAANTYGMGVAVGDFDNDGWADIYLTSFGPNTLYRNRGDGTFEDVTTRAGAEVDGWSSSAAFFDMENDGDLDLFVCSYLSWSYEKNVYCGERREGYRSYCHPSYFETTPSVLLRNNGDGTFSDVTRQAGVDLPGKALAVVTGDINGDGLADIYVANDTVANFLFENRGEGRFEETGLVAGVAYGPSARPESGMGTDFGDVDGDGHIDLIVTNIDYENNNLYLNQGDGFFSDVTVTRDLGRVALLYSGFGVRLLDYDNDGDLDLVVVNGHVLDNIKLYHTAVEFVEPPLLLENAGRTFQDVSDRAGDIWKKPMVGRALATADYDNDGDPDLLLVNNGQPPILLRNEGGDRNNWLGIHLKGVQSNRDAVGAVVTMSTDRRRLVRHRHGGGSYQAAHDPRLVFGLQEGESVKRLEIVWPSGLKQQIKSPELRVYRTVIER